MTPLPAPPRGKPPVFDPVKRLEYYVQKALAYGIDPSGIKIPGAGKTPKNAQEEIPEELLGKHISPVVKSIYSKPVIDSVEDSMTDEEILSKLSMRFHTLERLAQNVCEGKHRAVIVSGPGGIGKTYNIERKVEFFKENHDLKARVVKGGVVTPIQLYQLLWDTKEKGNVLVLDDSDNLFDEPDSLTLLKGALDTSEFRSLSWLAESKILAGRNIDNTFNYNGSIIFISNIDFHRVIHHTKSKMSAHLQALMTRCHYLDLKLTTQRALVLWVKHMVSKHHILVQQAELNKTQEQEVLNWLVDHKDVLRSIDLRTAIFAAEYYRDYGSSWKQVASDMLIK